MSLRHSQNFLHSETLVETLLSYTTLNTQDHVLEIGPGRGILTDTLAKRCRRVTAIEADAWLATALKRRYAQTPNVRIIQGDALSVPLPGDGYKVFASLPFNRTADFLRRLLDGPHRPTACGLIMQLEAAHKHLGLPRPTLLSTLRAPWFEMHVAHRFRRRDFRPKPRVDCVMVHIAQRPRPEIPHAEVGLYRDFVVKGFTAQKGTLRLNLPGIFGRRQFRRLADDCGFAFDAPPRALDAAQWSAVFRYFATHVDPAKRAKVVGAYARWLAAQHGLRKRRRHHVQRRERRR